MLSDFDMNSKIIIILFLIFVNSSVFVKCYCSDDRQTDAFRNAIIAFETALTGLSVTAAIPGFGIPSAVASIGLSTEIGTTTFAIFNAMDHSLINTNSDKYSRCKKYVSEMMTYNTALRGTGILLSACTMIPIFGVACIVPKIGVGITAAAAIASELKNWKQNSCYTITRDCDLTVGFKKLANILPGVNMDLG